MKQITCPHCADTYPDFDVAHVCSKGPYAPKLKPTMNKRIRDFEVASGLDIFGLGARREMWEAALEKYAKLIVGECADVITSMEHSSQYFPHVADAIKEHFGVEE